MSAVAPGNRSGLGEIVIATAVAGVAGYAVTWLVFRAVGAADYAVFAVFWSVTYLIVGGLSGIQQEITRATRPREDPREQVPPIARDFALLAAGGVLLLIGVATPGWVTAVFPEPGGGGWLILPLAVGTASYVIVAVVGGTLYGLSMWRALAAMVMLDGLLRLAFVAVAAALLPEPVTLAWAVALPFPISMVVVWLAVRRRVVGRSRLDVGLRPLTRNVAHTVIAAVSTGVLVSGLPFVLKLTSPDERAAALGVAVLAITLVRAPLIVTAMSLQSYLIVRFRGAERLASQVALVVVGVAIAGVVVAIASWMLGPWLFEVLFGAEAEVGGGFIAALVVSSAAIAAMFVTGPALLSRSRHSWNTAGWVTAALATAALLLVPFAFQSRIVLSLICAPLLGLAIHAVGLRRGRADA